VGSSPGERVGIELYWLPLGAGGNFVRLNGHLYEALKARLDRRPACDLYHSALMVFVPEGRYVIENTPVFDDRGHERGVVAEGPVGARWAGRFRMFRYELRRWRDGVIADIGEAVDSPRRLSGDLNEARRILELVPQMPNLVWGRDELGAGEMWNSNSMISWLIESTGLDAGSIKPPVGGHAPGWNAGIVVAARESRSIGAERRRGSAGSARYGFAGTPRRTRKAAPMTMTATTACANSSNWMAVGAPTAEKVPVHSATAAGK
jgi:hypothetical protein